MPRSSIPPRPNLVALATSVVRRKATARHGGSDHADAQALAYVLSRRMTLGGEAAEQGRGGSPPTSPSCRTCCGDERPQGAINCHILGGYVKHCAARHKASVQRTYIHLKLKGRKPYAHVDESIDSRRNRKCRSQGWNPRFMSRRFSPISNLRQFISLRTITAIGPARWCST
jgi:hypothetical protein